MDFINIKNNMLLEILPASKNNDNIFQTIKYIFLVAIDLWFFFFIKN